MDTHFLESFLTVVDEGSFAEAARTLGLTPAAVAQRIHALEADIGMPLLVRAGRTMRPTEAGVAILQTGRRIIREVGELQTLAAGRAVAGELRIGAISTAITGILPPVLKRLVKAAPQLDVYVVPGVSADLYRLLNDGEIDAAIVVRPQFAFPKALDWRPLRTEKLIFIGPGHLVGDDPLELLRTEPFIRYDRHNWGGRLVESYLRRTRIKPHDRLELDALDAIAVMVDQGLGVSLVPDWAPPWPAAISIRKLALPFKAPERNIGLVWSRSSAKVSLVKALMTAAIEPLTS